MSNAAVAMETGNVIQFEVLKFPKPKPISSKARVYSERDSQEGKSKEVYAFRTDEEIKAMIDVFDNRIANAHTSVRRQNARRNKMLFLVGTNIGLRASDLVTLRFSFFLDEEQDGKFKFKDYYTLQPKKQRKAKKFVKLFFNDAVKAAIADYLEEYPFDNIEDFLFPSQEGDGAITTCTLWRIIKGAAKEAGVEQNIGSHSLRKSFGYAVYHNAVDKNNALIVLQQIFAHSSPQVTARYIGLVDEDIESAFNSVNIGLEYL